MSFNAGEVYAILGGRFSPKGFEAFNAAMNGSARSAAAFEQNVSRSHKRASDSMEAFGRTATRVAQGGALALAGGLAASVKEAADFERSMRNVNSIAGLTPAVFERTRQSVLNMSRTTAQAPRVLADGLYQIYSSGIKGEGALKVLHASAVAASAGLTDTATSATAIVGALNAYHLSAGQAAKVSDILFQTVNRGVITFPQLAQTIGTVLPFANALKIPLNNVGAAISTLTKEGIPAAEATTYLKNSMVSFLKPSKDLSAAIKETGASSGEALIKSKGFEGALQAVIGATDGSKSAIQGLFPDIRASAAVLALTGTNAKTAADDLRNFGDAATKGASGKVFAEQAKSASFQFQQLKANLSAAAIAVGTVLLPQLNNGAKALSKFLGGAADSGQLQHVADDVKQGFDEAIHVVGDFVHVGGQVVGTISDVAGALGHLAGINIGDASQVEAVIAAYLGFKTVSTVVPILTQFGGAISTIAMEARTAPTLAAFFAGVPFGPLGVAATAVGALAAAFVLLGSNESQEAQIARESAAAHRENAAAIKSVMDAEAGAADKGLAAKQSTLDRKQAVLDAADALKKYGEKSPQYQRALLNEQQATLRSETAHKQYGNALSEQARASDKAVSSARARFEQAQKEAQQLSKPLNQAIGGGGKGLPGVGPAQIKANADAQVAADKALQRASQDYVQALARQQVSETSRQRLMSASDQITQKNALGISNLIRAMDGVPTAKQTKILLTGDQTALSRVGNLIASVHSVPTQKAIKALLVGDQPVKVKLAAVTALIKGVPQSTVAKILAQTNGEGSVRSLQGAIASVQSKSVTVSVTTQHVELFKKIFNPKAAGRPGRDGAEAALVGEGAAPEYIVNPRAGYAARVTGPTFTALSPGDYVVPTEPKYRGRALGFMADIAREMGIPAFAGGRRPANRWGSRPLPVPDPYSAGAVDETDLGNQVQREREAYQKRKASIASDEKKLKDLDKRLKDAKANEARVVGRKGATGEQKRAARKKTSDLDEKHKSLVGEISAFRNGGKGLQSLADMKKAFERDQVNLRKLQATNKEIVRLNKIQETDRAKMENASKAGNASAYGAAKTDRDQTLSTLKTKLQLALSLAKPGSSIAADLDSQLQGIISAQQEDVPFADQVETEADRMLQDGFTDAERQQLKNIQAGEALAALTPDLGDDIAAASQEQALLSQVLGEIQANPDARGGADTIAQVAGQLKNARDNIKSLTGGGTTNSNPDLQAQLDQANARIDAERQNSQVLAAAVQAFGGPGDIGTGRAGNAYGAAQGPTIVFQSYVPPSPSEARRLGEYTTSGLDLQGAIQSPRIQVGI